MNSNLIVRAIIALTLTGVFSLRADCSPDRIGQIWNHQDSLLITQALEKNSSSATPNIKLVDRSVLKFKPAPDSGVAQELADTLGRNALEKLTLKTVFLQIKQGYENEIAKENKSNDLAAALTFFIAANVMAYHQTEEPTDEATEELYESLSQAVSGIPEFSQMTNADKQKLHDFLVIIAGYVTVGHMDAKANNDQASLKTYKELAAYCLRLVLGLEPEKVKISEAGIKIESTPAPDSNAAQSASQIVGVWSKSASSPWSLAPSAIVTNAGYYIGRYIFAANGTYTFKGDSWGGPLRSNEFWTIEENGNYAVKADSLTINPKASKRTLRNRAGTVQKALNDAPQKVTYHWKLHYFEGLKETNLVLKPAKPVARDGGFTANSQFPKSYLYGAKNNLEWKF